MSTRQLVRALLAHPGVALKRDIASVARVLPVHGVAHWIDGGGPVAIRNGDDAAAIPDGDGYMLLAAEGMLPSFVARDPWFAGYCAVMVNVSDILAMGGRPYAVVDVLFSGDASKQRRVLEGLRDAAQAFGVPVVGGHTSRLEGSDTLLSAAVVGRARRLITSFDARPGDALLFAVDLRGQYRGDAPYFDAATHAPPEQLRAAVPLLSELAEAQLVHAGKDVSMAGIAGTLVMLCEGSGVGAVLEVEALPRPPQVSYARWMSTFPSFGFLLATAPEWADEVEARCAARGIVSARVGTFQARPTVELSLAGERAPFWDLTREALTGMGATLVAQAGAA
jgi:AIR synthase-related protein